MTADLHDGRVLLDRFALRRCLRARGSALWLAEDLHLRTPRLVQVYAAGGEAAGEVVEAIRRDARHHRGIRHAHLARIDELHEGPDLVLVSIETGDGELLASRARRTGPLPWRQLVTAVRPLVEALVHLHAAGAEHGCVDADHVLADDAARWILLPADRTTPARGGDQEQLGRLLATLLTGGHEPQERRPLNDAAEHLHGGRTIPALLDQLVGDLLARHAAARPAGMRDVLHRLDQLETFVAPAPPAAPSPAPPPAADMPPGPPTPPGPPERARSRTTAASRLAWAVAAVAVVAALALLVPNLRDRLSGPAPAAEAAEPDAQTVADRADEAVADPAAPGDAAGADDPRIARQREQAETALGDYLDARRHADGIGAAAWAGPPYEAALGAATAADRAFLETRYDAAAAGYTEATAALRAVVGSGPVVLARLLEEGGEALGQLDSSQAAAAFETALGIDPASEAARIGRQRATTLDEVSRLLASGREHEDAGRLEFAHADYAVAAELDPRSPAAADAYRRIKDALADAEFQAMMSRGLEAYHRGDHDDARVRLRSAALPAEAPAVAAALEMVEEAQRRDALGRLRTQALDHERQEAWQAAWNVYRQVLAIDPAVGFAQEGRTRSETMIRLQTQSEHFLQHLDLLIQPGSREDAAAIVAELEAVTGRGPRMQETYDRLAEQVRRANTPLRVELRSDGETEVDVYRVGRYGRFRTVDLELLPGVYTVVGHRKGYKDVRLTLHLRPGDTEAALTVICTEGIR